MRIGINTLYVVPGLVGGAEYYLVNLLTGLFAQDRENEYVLFVSPENRELYQPVSPNFRKITVPISNTNRGARVLFEQTALPYLIRRERLDILHSPNNMAPIVKSCGSVVTIQSMHAFVDGFLKNEDLPFLRFWYFRQLVRRSIRQADHVITPSEAARRDTIRLLNTPPDRVTPILDYVSIPTLFPDGIQTQPEVLARYGIERPYIFSPSSLYRYKNVDGMLRAMHLLGRHGLPHRLVVAGRDDFGNLESMRTLAESLGVEDRFVYLGSVPHDDTPSLYRYADVTLFPTYRETFGIPVLESMAIGTPVVCSNVSSVPEVAGEAALQVDPDDVEAMSEALRRVIEDPSLRETLRAKGRKRSEVFECNRAARETIRIYRAVYERRLNGRPCAA